MNFCNLIIEDLKKCKTLSISWKHYENNLCIIDATGSNMEIGGAVDDEDEEEFYDSEPLPILGRCKSLYPFEGN